MARKNILKTFQPKDPEQSRFQANVKDAVDLLAADHDVLSSAVSMLIASAAIPPGASIVTYSGGPGQTLSLPPANALGTSVAAVVILLNTATVAVTLVPTRGDTLNGGTSFSISAGAPYILTSDGTTKWLAAVPGAPTGAQYLVGAADPTLTAERVVTDTGSITWDLGTAGQAKANVVGFDELTPESDLSDLERRFRLLLSWCFLTFSDIPPGLEKEIPIALAQ